MVSLSYKQFGATVPDCGAPVNLLQPSFRGDRALAGSNPETRRFAVLLDSGFARKARAPE
jgi:hypothetical protein